MTKLACLVFPRHLRTIGPGHEYGEHGQLVPVQIYRGREAWRRKNPPARLHPQIFVQPMIWEPKGPDPHKGPHVSPPSNSRPYDQGLLTIGFPY